MRIVLFQFIIDITALCRRSLCLTLVLSSLLNILLYDIAFADGENTGRHAFDTVYSKKLDIDAFTLPGHLGYVKEITHAPDPAFDGRRPFTVIHIQDAHCNYYAQRRIAEIVEYLNREYGIDLVNLEGGAKNYDLSIFTDIKDRSQREKASDHFVKEGIVTGAEYFAVNNPDKVTLWGVEDTKLYTDNLKVYLNSINYRQDTDISLRHPSTAISRLKLNIFSKELLDFDMMDGAYRSGNMDFKKYISYLVAAADRKKIDISNLANIYLLSGVLRKEGEIDFKKADRQRDTLIERLHKRLSKNAIKTLSEKTVEFKEGLISQDEFYSHLISKAKDFGVDLSGVNEFLEYKSYISAYDSIDKAGTIKEVYSLEGSLKDAIISNDTERQLSRLSEDFSILKGILSISATPDEYRYYHANRDAFRISRFTDFIERNGKAMSFGRDPEEPEGGSAGNGFDYAGLDRYREEISRFYEYSFKRDEAFIRNIRFSRCGAAILITGGFHTDNLKELFIGNGISFISIMPNFKNPDGYSCPYFRVLSGGDELSLTEILPHVLKNLLAPYSRLNPSIGRAVDPSFGPGPEPIIGGRHPDGIARHLDPGMFGKDLMTEFEKMNGGRRLAPVQAGGTVIYADDSDIFNNAEGYSSLRSKEILDKIRQVENQYIYASVIDAIIDDKGNALGSNYRILVARRDEIAEKDLLNTASVINANDAAVDPDENILFYIDFSVMAHGRASTVMINGIGLSKNLAGRRLGVNLYRNLIKYLTDNFAGMRVVADIISPAALHLFQNYFDRVEVYGSFGSEGFVRAFGVIPDRSMIDVADPKAKRGAAEGSSKKGAARPVTTVLKDTYARRNDNDLLRIIRSPLFSSLTGLDITAGEHTVVDIGVGAYPQTTIEEAMALRGINSRIRFYGTEQKDTAPKAYISSRRAFEYFSDQIGSVLDKSFRYWGMDLVVNDQDEVIEILVSYIDPNYLDRLRRRLGDYPNSIPLTYRTLAVSDDVELLCGGLPVGAVSKRSRLFRSIVDYVGSDSIRDIISQGKDSEFVNERGVDISIKFNPVGRVLDVNGVGFIASDRPGFNGQASLITANHVTMHMTSAARDAFKNMAAEELREGGILLTKNIAAPSFSGAARYNVIEIYRKESGALRLLGNAISNNDGDLMVETSQIFDPIRLAREDIAHALKREIVSDDELLRREGVGADDIEWSYEINRRLEELKDDIDITNEEFREETRRAILKELEWHKEDKYPDSRGSRDLGELYDAGFSSSTTLKIVGDEDADLDPGYRDGILSVFERAGPDEAIEDAVDIIAGLGKDRAPPRLTLNSFEIRLLDNPALAGSLLIPRHEGAQPMTAGIPAIGVPLADGRVAIYVTRTFYEDILKYEPSMLAELIDHEFIENILRRSHREASARARYFAVDDEDGNPVALSPYHRWILGLIEDPSFLSGMLYEERPWVTDAAQKRYEAFFRVKISLIIYENGFEYTKEALNSLKSILQADDPDDYVHNVVANAIAKIAMSRGYVTEDVEAGREVLSAFEAVLLKDGLDQHAYMACASAIVRLTNSGNPDIITEESFRPLEAVLKRERLDSYVYESAAKTIATIAVWPKHTEKAISSLVGVLRKAPCDTAREAAAAGLARVAGSWTDRASARAKLSLENLLKEEGLENQTYISVIRAITDVGKSILLKYEYAERAILRLKEVLAREGADSAVYDAAREGISGIVSFHPEIKSAPVNDYWTDFWKSSYKTPFGPEKYSGNIRRFWERFFRSLSEDVVRAEGYKPRIIDVGTGKFGVLFVASEACPGAFDLYGIDQADIDKSVVRGAENIEFKRCSTESINYQDSYFDALTASYSLEYSPDMLRALSEAYRVMKPGARAALMLHHPRSAIVENARAKMDGIRDLLARSGEIKRIALEYARDPDDPDKIKRDMLDGFIVDARRLFLAGTVYNQARMLERHLSDTGGEGFTKALNEMVKNLEAIARFKEQLIRAGDAVGGDQNRLRAQMWEAGFTDVVVEPFYEPDGLWGWTVMMRRPYLSGRADIREMAGRIIESAGGPREILDIISEIAEEPDASVRARREMALRTAVMVKGLGDIPKDGHANIVGQLVPPGQGNPALHPIQEMISELGRYPYNLYSKSIIGEGIDEAGLNRLITMIGIALADESNPDPKALILLPATLKGSKQLMTLDPRIRVQYIEQGDEPDIVSQFGLGFMMLEYDRLSPEARNDRSRYSGLINLISAMVDLSDYNGDPSVAINALFTGTLKIRKVELGNVDQRRKAWEAFATSL